MFLHAESLKKASVAIPLSAILALASGCSSAGPDGIPGSGYHHDPGATGSSTGGSSGGGSGSSSGASSTGSSGGSSSSGAGSSSSSGATGSSGSGGSSSGGAMTTISADTTWASGQQIASSVTIAPGVTVTIAPGATVTVAAGATIDVAGTLTASSASGTHAKLTGTGWTGISVASGGTLALDGVDITGASSALVTVAGAIKAEYDDGTITGAATPFDVAKGTTLGTKHATVTGTLGYSQISGAFVASFLDYDSNGHEGLVTMDPTATESIEDSKLHGSGAAADMVVSGTGAASIHIAYSSITNVHCAFHFNAITAFDVSYTNVQSNSYGFMLYGSSGTGTRSVKYSNIDQNQIAYDTTAGANGPITFDHDYITGTQNPADAVSVTNTAAAAVAGTGPR